jgi:lysozyme
MPDDVIFQRQVNAAGVGLVKSFESLRLQSYNDGFGNWTIGWGHTGPDVTPKMVISAEQAEQLLAADLQTASTIITRNVTVPLGDNQFAALGCFVFNIGPGRPSQNGYGGKDGFVSLKNGNPSTLLRSLNNGWYEQIPSQLMQWVHANGEVLGGLSRRRAAEAALWNKSDQISI